MSVVIKPGHVLVEVVSGPAGPSLYIGDNDTSERVAGKKPWAGGTTLHTFQVAVKDIARLAVEYGHQGVGYPEYPDAEIEALRAEVLRLRTDNSESFRDAAILANIRRDEAEARAERLAEALQWYAEQAEGDTRRPPMTDDLIERLRTRANEERERSKLIHLLTEAADALEAAREDAERWRHARKLLTIDDIEGAQSSFDSFGGLISEEECSRADAAIDAARETRND